jgi:hypothetical protein
MIILLSMLPLLLYYYHRWLLLLLSLLLLCCQHALGMTRCLLSAICCVLSVGGAWRQMQRHRRSVWLRE